MATPIVRLDLLGLAGARSADGSRLDVPHGKPLALLAYLALNPDPVPRDKAAGLLWPRSSRRKARGSLRQAIWRLRQALPSDPFLEGDALALAPGAVETDIESLRRHLAAGELDEATELWTGPPLADLHLPDAPGWNRWCEGRRQELEEALAGALAERGARERGAGAGEAAARWFEAAREVQPHVLRHHVALSQTLVELRAFERARAALSLARRQVEDRGALRRIEALEARLETVRQGSAGGREAAARPDPLLRMRFTGRIEEFATLARAWRQARSGKAAVALLVGEAGIGKTRLCEEITHFARSEEGRVVRVKAEDGERPIEWGLLGELVDHLLHLSGAAGISSGSLEVLRTVVPSIPGGGGAPPPIASPPFQLSRTRPSAALSDALEDLLAAVAEDAPLLVVIDDLQWADSESRAIVARACSRLERTSVLVLVTSRPAGQERTPRMRKTIELLARAAGPFALELGPLSQGEIRELLAEAIRAPDQEDADPVIERVVRTSRGNPLFIIELLKVLQDRGILTDADGEDGAWRLHPERVPPDLPVPQSLRELIDRQLDELPEAASLVAAHLAEARHPVSARVLGTRPGLDPEGFSAGVAELVQRRMVRWESGEKLAFAHDELRAAVARRFRLHVGLTTGGGTQWSLFRSAVVASVILLTVSAAAYAFRGSTLPMAPSLGGGPLLIVQADGQVVEARAPAASPAAGWRFHPAAQRWGEPDRVGPGPLRLASIGDTRILEVVVGRDGADSARVHRPDGSLVDERGWDRILGVAWCGGTPPSLLLSVQHGEDVNLLRWEPEPGAALPLEVPGFPGVLTACSPDGRYGAVLTATGGESGIQLLDLERGSSFPLPFESAGAVRALHWPPEDPAPIPTGVELLGPATQGLDWGARLQLEARVQHSDGSYSADNLQWRSRDPGIASVTSGGLLTANRPGETLIEVSFDGWLADSLRLLVRETERAPRVLLWDPTPPGGGHWRRDPQRLPLTDGLERSAATEPMFQQVEESWRSADEFRLPAGGTLETEFTMQRPGGPLRACLALAGGEPVQEAGPASRTSRREPAPAAVLCLTLRSATGDPTDAELHFHRAFPALPVPVPPSAPGETRWRHAALGLLPDGAGVAYLDGQEVARTPIRLPLPADGRWRIVLEGMTDEDTGEPLSRTLRNVLLWPEVRFRDPAGPPPPTPGGER